MTTISAGTTGAYTFTGPDSVQVTLDPNEQANVVVTAPSGRHKYRSSMSTSRTLGPFGTGDVMAISAVRGNVDYSILQGNARTLAGNYTLQATDDQQSFDCASALTISIPDGLSPRPTITVTPPPTGNVSFAMLGAETLNGALTTLTRARSANVGGVVLKGYTDAATYGLTGA